jgi:hypothetical protein
MKAPTTIFDTTAATADASELHQRNTIRAITPEAHDPAPTQSRHALGLTRAGEALELMLPLILQSPVSPASGSAR